MDQVVSDLDVRECAPEPFTGEDVAADHLDLRGSPECVVHARRVARQRTQIVTVGEQLGSEHRADEAAGAGEENVHVGQ